MKSLDKKITINLERKQKEGSESLGRTVTPYILKTYKEGIVSWWCKNQSQLKKSKAQKARENSKKPYILKTYMKKSCVVIAEKPIPSSERELRTWNKRAVVAGNG